MLEWSIEMQTITVSNVRLIELPTYPDKRGKVSVCEGDDNLPFQVQRFFTIYDTTGDSVRGEHAHKRSWQLHQCFGGSVTTHLDDGNSKQTIVLDNPRTLLLVGPMVWHPFILQEGASLLVVSSTKYDPDDYFRSYEEFIRAVKGV